jgi:hypothetical protein
MARRYGYIFSKGGLWLLVFPALGWGALTVVWSFVVKKSNIKTSMGDFERGLDQGLKNSENGHNFKNLSMIGV